jgi:hypothetical protein
MATTESTLEKDTVENKANSCDQDWCNSPDGETLPCFDCFDPKQDYEVESSQ